MTDPDDLDPRDREAVRTQLFRLADDELVVAERYTEWQVRAPTLESDLSISNIAQDEYGHARLWYDLLKDFGATEPDLIWERDPTDFNHATVVERPFEEGDWADAILRNYLYDVAEQLRLEALEASAYHPLADRVPTVQGEEEYHREHAQSWLERLADDDTGRDRLQTAVDASFPAAMTLFAPVDPEIEARIEDRGYRTRSLDALREDWTSITVPFLESLGLTVPEPERPDATGRDGSHTEAWADLHAEMTNTYRELGRSAATQIMEDPR
ncbi:MAG: 1,2-phenylacetyl-CoA epoxidase subunit PaaC [Halobacteriaceae archaeon]